MCQRYTNIDIVQTKDKEQKMFGRKISWHRGAPPWQMLYNVYITVYLGGVPMCQPLGGLRCIVGRGGGGEMWGGGIGLGQ